MRKQNAVIATTIMAVVAMLGAGPDDKPRADPAEASPKPAETSLRKGREDGAKKGDAAIDYIEKAKEEVDKAEEEAAQDSQQEQTEREINRRLREMVDQEARKLSTYMIALRKSEAKLEARLQKRGANSSGDPDLKPIGWHLWKGNFSEGRWVAPASPSIETLPIVTQTRLFSTPGGATFSPDLPAPSRPFSNPGQPTSNPFKP